MKADHEKGLAAEAQGKVRIERIAREVQNGP